MPETIDAYDAFLAAFEVAKEKADAAKVALIAKNAAAESLTVAQAAKTDADANFVAADKQAQVTLLALIKAAKEANVDPDEEEPETPVE